MKPIRRLNPSSMANPLSLLLDTHVLLWWLGESSRLPRAARDAIAASDAVYVSAASAWEIGIKTSQGKLDFPGDLGQELLRNQFHLSRFRFDTPWPLLLCRCIIAILSIAC